MNREEYQEIINTYKKENKELIESGKCKKMFTEILPKRGKKCIDWENSISCKIHFIYNNIEDDLIIIKHNKLKLIVMYNNKEYIFDISHFKECKIGKIFGIQSGDWRIEIGQTFKDNKRNITIIDREKRTRYKKDGSKCNDKWYKYHCNKCDNEDWIEESKILNLFRGCNRCCKLIQKVDETNCVATTHPHLIKYFVNKEDAYKYSYGSNKILLFKCPNCGFEKEMKISTLTRYGFSCSKCSDGISYPNKFMFNLLEQLNIKFINEYSPDWIKPKRYDFYIPSMNLIIEMDGGFHYIDNNLSGQTANKIQEIDNYKDLKAKEHNIEVIRIDCNYKYDSRFKYIKNNVLHSKLNEIFDLNNINWFKIDKQSQKSLIKEVCDYWHLHNDINYEELNFSYVSKIFNISNESVKSYLDIGIVLGWCNKLENGGYYKTLDYNYIEAFKNEKSLGVFKNASQLSKKSEDLFNIKLLDSGIRNVLRGERKQYKRFTFEYISKQEYEDYINNNI